MPFLKSGIFFFLCLFLCSVYSSQTLRFNKYTSSDGLLSDEVYNLHQDKNGYIWAFTNYGTLKYNGSEFKQVLKNLPFNESFIYSIYENEQGKKWVANSNAKIYEIINDSAFCVKGTEETSDLLRKTVSEIMQLHVDDSLNIYAITKHHCYKFKYSKNGYQSHKLSTGEKDSIAYRIYEKNNKLLRVLNYYDNDSTFCGGRENLKVLLYEKSRTSYLVLDCEVSQPRFFKRFGNDIYFSNHNKIGKINGGKIVSVIPFNAIVMNFVKDKNHHLWVACYNNGLFELNENDSVINHYFEETTINDVLIDSQNGLWVSSTGAGLFHCTNLNDLYFTESLALGKPINYIKIIGDELYVANSIGDVFCIKNNQKQLIRKHLKEDEPFDLLKIKSNYLFANRFSVEQSGLFTSQTGYDLQRPSYAIKLIAHKTDSIFFLQRKNLFLFTKGVFKRVISFNYKAYSFEIRNGKALLAMENGIWQVSNDSLFQPHYLKETKNSIFKSIVKDALNNYWFCSTGNGVFKLNSNNELSHFDISNGLPGNIINNISFSNAGILLSTSTGLYFTSMMGSGNYSFPWKCIYSGSVQNALFFEDKIYLSTQNGLVILDKKKIYDSENIYFNLSGIKVNSQETNPDELKNLSHDKNNLEFMFDLISFNRDKYNLKYYLNGEFSDSGSVNFNTISFQKLSPGNYTLMVYPNLVKGEKLKVKITFSIIPAFWQTTTFLVLIFICFILICTYVVYAIFKYLKKKETKKTTAERLILEYKLIALKAQINPHFMSNCLTAIQHLIINNKVDQATDYIAKFGLLVRQILNFSTRSLVTLQEELEIARLNIELEQLRFEKKFLFEIKIDPNIALKNIFIPALILNPIIENAIWHGLLPLKNKRDGKLLIEVKVESSVLILVIEDNGVGRKQAQENLSNSRESKGIALTEQRLNNINYMFDITTSQLVYTDLENESKDALGTRVIISLPLNLKPLQNE